MNWKQKLKEVGFTHPPLIKFIENLIKGEKPLKLCEDGWCEAENVRGFKHYIQNPKCMYFSNTR